MVSLFDEVRRERSQEAAKIILIFLPAGAAKQQKNRNGFPFRFCLVGSSRCDDRTAQRAVPTF
jgi:hypothetical protein